jgi:glycosyltransferase 2 family protein
MAGRTVRRAIIVLLAIGVGAIFLHSSAAEIQARHLANAFSRLRPETIAGVLGLSIVSMLISGGIWSRLLTRMGYDLPVTAGLGAYASAGLAGYVMNAAGSAVGGVMSLRLHGVCPTRAVLLTVIANALGLCGVLVWAPVGLVLLSRSGMSSDLPLLGHHGAAAAAIALCCLGLVMLVVLWLLTAAPEAGGRLLRRLVRAHTAVESETAARARPALHAGNLLALVLWSAASWFAGAMALYMMLGGMGAGADVNLADVVGAAALAATFGSLAFFVPAGVGVRDGVLIALLTHATGVPMVTCTAAAITIRALDPLMKVGLLVVVASGLGKRFVGLYVGTSALASEAARRDGGRISTSLARLSTRLSTPLLEVAAFDAE